MTKKYDLTEKGIGDLVRDFEEKENHTLWSFDTMDAYVMYNHPDEFDEWLETAFAIPQKKDKNGVDRSDIKEVRKIFVEKYFSEHTEEAIKARKEEEKKIREAEKQAKKEAEANKSPAEKRKIQIKMMLEKAKRKAEEAKE